MKTSPNIEKLRRELHQANHNYHVLGTPFMTDERFDQLFRELKDLEAKHPEFADPNSPTKRVGGKSITSFTKVQHRVPMLSLENTFSAEEVRVYFVSRLFQDVIIGEPKIDGLSLSLTYKDGALIQAITRGDGTTGDDVTDNARTITTIPLILAHKFTGEVRGEVYMSKKQFDKLNKLFEEQGEEVFANPRNAAAGSMKRKDTKEVARRGLSFIAYSVIGKVAETTQTGLLRYLETLGFQTPLKDIEYCSANDLTTIRGLIDRFTKKRSSFEYEIDGIVLKIENLATQEDLGLNNRSPNWATSYKFPPEQKVTTLLNISIQVGRTGALTPVAELEPTNLAGSVVKRASLHNFEEIERLNVNIGDEVVIQKAAEIIPQIVAVHKKHTNSCFPLPYKCPSCGSKVVKNVNQAAIYCVNVRHCTDQIQQRLIHATSKQCLDIDGCGESTIEKLVEQDVITLADLMEIKNVEFLGNSNAAKFKIGREKAKLAPLWRKINALGVDGVGVNSSKELCNKFSSLQEMINNPVGVRDILGPVASQNFTVYMCATYNAEEIARLEQLGYHFKEDRKVGKLTGKSFCITGTLKTGGRDEVAAKIEEAGGAVKTSVTKKIDYLVVGAEAGKGKTDGAKKFGVRCITEEQLLEMF